MTPGAKSQFDCGSKNAFTFSLFTRATTNFIDANRRLRALALIQFSSFFVLVIILFEE